MRSALTFILIQAALITPALSHAGQDVSLDKLPPAVRATVERETKGGQITEIELDREQGKVVYEVEFKANGKKWEIEIAEDGTLLERRED